MVVRGPDALNRMWTARSVVAPVARYWHRDDKSSDSQLVPLLVDLVVKHVRVTRYGIMELIAQMGMAALPETAPLWVSLRRPGSLFQFRSCFIDSTDATICYVWVPLDRPAR